MNTAEFVACRLTSHDAATANFGHVRFLRRFHENYALLQKSWVLQVPMSNRLRCSPFNELDISELMEVRRCLQLGLAIEYSIPCGGLNPQNPKVWITLAHVLEGSVGELSYESQIV